MNLIHIQIDRYLRFFAWLLCGSVIVHTALLFTITDPTTPSALAIRHLHPLALFGAMVLLLIAAQQQHQRRHQWALRCYASAMFVGMLASLLLIQAPIVRTPIYKLVIVMLYVVLYASALLGSALCFPHRSGWFGSAVRVLLDSIAVGVAAFVLMQSIFPLLLHPWPWSPHSLPALTYLAFDISIIFAVSALCLRYRRVARPVIVPVLLSMLCLFIAESIFMLLSWIPGGEHHHFIEAPLYTLHSVLLALSAYRSTQHPLQFPPTQMTVMPIGEWLFWIGIPRISVIAAFAAIALFRAVPLNSIAWLLLVGLARELWAAYEQRSVLLALHRAQDRAHNAEAHIEAFLARIIHDLATPVQGLQTMLRRSTSDSHADVRVQSHIYQLHHLVIQLRAYQQVQYLRTTIPPSQAVDLSMLCAAAIDAIQDDADERAIKVRLEIDSQATTVHADNGSLRRVLDNLLKNALAATATGGEVVVRTRLSSIMTIQIEVQDNGCGMTVAQQQQIFTPFVHFRAGGMGLGLAIVHELVQAMGGRCGVISNIGSGSLFWIQLQQGAREGDLHARYPTSCCVSD